MTKHRTETDSLGLVEVPSEALYGAQTARAVINFPISGLRANPFLIRALAMIKLRRSRSQCGAWSYYRGAGKSHRAGGAGGFGS